MASGDAPRRSFLFSFGIDKLGLVALKAPRLSAVLIALLTVAAVFGVMSLRVDDSLSELFRTDTREFRQYEEIDRRFPSSEYDVLVVVEGKGSSDAARPRSLPEGDRRTAIDRRRRRARLHAVGARQARRNRLCRTDRARTTLPEEGPDFDAMLAALKSNDIVNGKFLSDDGDARVDRHLARPQGGGGAVGAHGHRRHPGRRPTRNSQARAYRAKLTGAPVMQLEIRNAVERDRFIYNGLGFLAGLVVAFLFFRRISLTLIAVLGPTIAILWTLGVLGGLDYRLNLFINVITPLILVSGFSDSMHLVFAIRRDILAGVDRASTRRETPSATWRPRAC